MPGLLPRLLQRATAGLRFGAASAAASAAATTSARAVQPPRSSSPTTYSLGGRLLVDADSIGSPSSSSSSDNVDWKSCVAELITANGERRALQHQQLAADTSSALASSVPGGTSSTSPADHAPTASNPAPVAPRTPVRQVIVYWDHENYSAGVTVVPVKFVEELGRLTRHLGEINEIRLYAGITTTLPVALSQAGITVIHVPHDGKSEVVDRRIQHDIWRLTHFESSPPTTTVVLISSDSDFTPTLLSLRTMGFKTVVVADPNTAYCSDKLIGLALSATEPCLSWNKLKAASLASPDDVKKAFPNAAEPLPKISPTPKAAAAAKVGLPSSSSPSAAAQSTTGRREALAIRSKAAEPVPLAEQDPEVIAHIAQALASMPKSKLKHVVIEQVRPRLKQNGPDNSEVLAGCHALLDLVKPVVRPNLLVGAKRVEALTRPHARVVRKMWSDVLELADKERKSMAKTESTAKATTTTTAKATTADPTSTPLPPPPSSESSAEPSKPLQAPPPPPLAPATSEAKSVEATSTAAASPPLPPSPPPPPSPPQPSSRKKSPSALYKHITAIILDSASASSPPPLGSKRAAAFKKDKPDAEPVDVKAVKPPIAAPALAGSAPKSNPEEASTTSAAKLGKRIPPPPPTPPTNTNRTSAAITPADESSSNGTSPPAPSSSLRKSLALSKLPLPTTTMPPPSKQPPPLLAPSSATTPTAGLKDKATVKKSGPLYTQHKFAMAPTASGSPTPSPKAADPSAQPSGAPSVADKDDKQVGAGAASPSSSL